MKLAESFVGHGAATDLYDLAFTPSTGGSINSVTKKALCEEPFRGALAYWRGIIRYLESKS